MIRVIQTGMQDKCVCGCVPRLQYNVLFRSRVICPACGRQTRWHADWRAAQEEWERKGDGKRISNGVGKSELARGL